MPSWLIYTVYHLLVENKKVEGRGAYQLSFPEEGAGDLLEKGDYLRGGGGLNRGFTVITKGDSLMTDVFSNFVIGDKGEKYYKNNCLASFCVSKKKKKKN